MGTPLGDFVRAKRDSLQPEDLGLPLRSRRRAPGLRRTELADRAGSASSTSPGSSRAGTGTRRSRHQRALRRLGPRRLPSDATCLPGQDHRRRLLRAAPERSRPSARSVRAAEDARPARAGRRDGHQPTGRRARLHELVRNTHEAIRPPGRATTPNLTRYVFTDPRAKSTFPDWGHVADEQAFNLWLGPSVASSEWFKAELAPIAGPEFSSRIDQHLPPPRRQLRTTHPDIAGELRWDREVLDTFDADEQQLVVYLPGDEATAQAIGELRVAGSRQGCTPSEPP